MFKLLGALVESAGIGGGSSSGNGIFSLDGIKGTDYEYLTGIVTFLNEIIVPLTVVLAISAAIMAVVFGTLIIKAEDAEKQKEMKKRLIGLMITVVTVTVVVWVFGFVISNFGTIMNAIRDAFNGATGAGG